MPTGMPPMEDAGPPVPGGPPVGSVANDAGMDMAGRDMRAADMDPAPPRGPAGPWPLADITNYESAQGLSGDIIDSSPDDAQNIWAATSDALFLLKPHTGAFVKYTAADGLHIQPFTDPDGNPAQTNITAIAGGGPNQVFVGYYGYESDATRDTDPDSLTQLGWADRVNLGSNGKITTHHYWFHCDKSPGIVEDRSVRRMIYAHEGTARGHLFLGMDHGVVHIFDDAAGDHVHPEVWYQRTNDSPVEKIGENYGLFIKDDGDLWIAGGYGVGLQTWNPVPYIQWVQEPFKDAFTVYTSNHALNVPYGYREDQRGVAVSPDGTVWFASVTHGLWSYSGVPYDYGSVRNWTAAPTDLVDLAADPDGTLWLVNTGGQLLRFNPKTNAYSAFPGISDARRIVIDTTVMPRALYVSRTGGLSVIRAK